jgi:metal-responsive CopG/Arc/MetJ family transcriptional regulator
MSRVIDKKGNVVRATISFPHNVYDSLEERASRKKVSIAWVVRDAVESYLGTPVQEDSLPYLDNTEGIIQDTDDV